MKPIFAASALVLSCLFVLATPAWANKSAKPAAVTAPVYESFEGPEWKLDASAIGIRSSAPHSVGWAGPIEYKVDPARPDGTQMIRGAAPMRYQAQGLVVDGGSRYLSVSGTDPWSNQRLVIPFGINFDSSSHFYYSFLLRLRGSFGYDSIQIAAGTSSGDATNTQPRFGIKQTQTGEFFVGCGPNETLVSGHAPDVVYFVVVKAVSDGSQWVSAELYMNPPTAFKPSTPTAVATGPKGPRTNTVMVIRLGSIEPGDLLEIDEIRVGRTWAEVVPGASAALEEM